VATVQAAGLARRMISNGITIGESRGFFFIFFVGFILISLYLFASLDPLMEPQALGVMGSFARVNDLMGYTITYRPF
jgi:hypothetical protein